MSATLQRQPYIPKRTTPIGFYKDSGVTKPISQSVARTVYVPSHQSGQVILKFTHDIAEFGKIKSQHLAKKIAIQKTKQRYRKIDTDLDMFVKMGLISGDQYNQLKNELRHEYETYPLGKFPSEDLRKKMNTVAQLAFAKHQQNLREQKLRQEQLIVETKEKQRQENLMKPERSPNDPYIPFSNKVSGLDDEIIGHDYSRKENIHASGKRTKMIEGEEPVKESNSGDGDFEEQVAVLSAQRSV